MAQKEIRKCVICGNRLRGKQKECCSIKCRQKHHKNNTKTVICTCGKEFECNSFSRQKYCEACQENKKYKKVKEVETRPNSELDRPYTKETANIIRMFHESGDSLDNIALALGRSVENVKLAFK